ncbi:MAG: helical backbone metal receptor [Proteobacteria bacterium]|nr:helical backbone metal receptor [Pseudomonadota bacterium]
MKTVLILLASLCLSACNQPAEPDEERKTAIRIVALSPHITELVFSAGAGDKLVGVSSFSDFPEDALSITQVGDAFRLDYEQLSVLLPDLIFYWDGGTSKQLVQQLVELNFKLIPIRIDQLEDIPKAILQIARLAGTHVSPQVSEFSTYLAQLKSQPAPHLRGLIQLSDQPIFTVNGDHWMSEAVNLCGVENIFSDLELPSAAVDFEAIVDRDPELIIRLETGQTSNMWSEWPSISAVKENRIIELNPDHFSRPTLRILEGIKALCKTLEK